MGKLVLHFRDKKSSTIGLEGCVFTNGCFDILHRGHMELFRFCHRQKNIKSQRPVVVGVNSDKSIKELKGSTRPFIGEIDRTEVLVSIQWIDYVIVFDTKSVFPLIEALRPQVLVKGGNYNTKPCAVADQIVGQEFVESYGGQVLTGPMVEGVSTTEIVKRIVEIK